MGEGRDNQNTDFSFMQETIKQKKIYQTKIVQKLGWSMVCGALFAATALIIWAWMLPKLGHHVEQQEVQPIVIPEEVEETDDEPEEVPVYITETISMELEDYKKMYQ